MSAFAAIFQRRGERVQPGEVSRLLDAGRSVEGKIVEHRRACIGVEPFSTTIENRGVTQPIHDPESGLDLVLTGRLDNRRELLQSLASENLTPVLSDARLALAAYKAWGPRCFDRLVGPFAILIYDARRHYLVCARDAIGDQSLYYHLGADQVIVASRVSAILHHPGVSKNFDEVALAHFFAVDAPPPGRTFFADIRELPPAHRLTLEGDRQHLESSWRPQDLPEIRYRRDADYIEHFRSLLEESVRCRLRSSSPPAILMSGGLDSTSVAAMAAQELNGSAPGTRLASISWVFDELQGADERRFMNPVIERFGLSAHFIFGDGEWPLRDFPTWPIPVDAPWQGLYPRLQNAAYAEARAAGASVLLTGEFGDHLYAEQACWLRDLVLARRGVSVWRELRREFSDRSLGSILHGPTRGALARALGWRGRRPAPPAWLTPFARDLLETPQRKTSQVLDPRCAMAAGLSNATARRAGIEVRLPYRDRRLIEFILASPAHLLYRPGHSKWILRETMRGVLPETVRQRRYVSSLLPLAARGLIERERHVTESILQKPDALWRQFVSQDWLTEAFPDQLRSGLDGVESVVAWQCICSQLWSENTR